MSLAPWSFQLLGYSMRLAQPVFLLAMPLVVLLMLTGIFLALKRRDRLSKVIEPRLSTPLSAGVFRWPPLARSVVEGVALLLLAVALAQPQCGTRAELTQRRGLDIVVALDASRSMLARDVAPSRLERAKLELMALLDELKGDRVGLVVFAGDAFIQCPLTTDYDAAKMFLRAVDPNQMQQGGSDIGSALRLARQMLAGEERNTADQVVVLISDGEDLRGDAIEAAEELGASDVRIFAVGVGSEEGEPIPELDEQGQVLGYKRGPDGQTVITRLDKKGLQRIAEVSHGELFHRLRGIAMAEVVARIDRLQKSELESRLRVRYDERFARALIPGLLLLTLSAVIELARRRK